MKKIATRITSMALAVMMTANIGLPVFAQSETPKIAVSPISAVEAAGTAELTEQYPNGIVSFAVSELDVDEGNTDGMQMAIVRQGGTIGSVSVDLRALDLTSEYGRDYTIKVYNGVGEKQGALKADPDAEPIVVAITDDKVTDLAGIDDADTVIEETVSDMIDNGETTQLTIETNYAESGEENAESEANSEPIEEVPESEAASMPTEEAPESEAASVPVEEVPESEAASVPVEEVPESEAASESTEENTVLVDGVELTAAHDSGAYTLQQAKAADTGVDSDAIVWENLTESEQQILLESINATNDEVLQDALQAIPAASTTLTFAEGEYVKYVVVTPKDDSTPEADEEFYMLLTNPQGGLVCGEISYSLCTITNDDEGGISTVTLADTRISDDGTQALVTVQRKGALAQYSTVYVGTSEGSASDGVDYNGGIVQLVFTPGMEQQTASVHIVPNEYRTEPRDFNFVLTTDDEASECGEESIANCIIPADITATSADETAVSSDEITIEYNANAGDTFATGLTGEDAEQYANTILPDGAFLVDENTDLASLTEDQRKIVVLAQKMDAINNRETPKSCVYLMYTAFTNVHPENTDIYPTKNITQTYDGVTYNGINFANKTPSTSEAAKITGMNFAGAQSFDVYCSVSGEANFSYANTSHSLVNPGTEIRTAYSDYKSSSWTKFNSSVPQTLTTYVGTASNVSVFGARIGYYTINAKVDTYAKAAYGSDKKVYRRDVEVKEVNGKTVVNELSKKEYTPGQFHAVDGATSFTDIFKGGKITFLPDYSSDNPNGLYSKLAGVRLRWEYDYVDLELSTNALDGSITLEFDDTLLSNPEMCAMLQKVSLSGPQNRVISICPYYKAVSPNVTLKASPIYAQLQDFSTNNQTILPKVVSGDTIKNFAVRPRVLTEDVTVKASFDTPNTTDDAAKYLKFVGNRQGDKSIKLYDYTVTSVGSQTLSASSTSPAMQLSASPRVYAVHASAPIIRLDGAEYDMSKDADREKYGIAAAKAAEANSDIKYWTWFTLQFDENLPQADLARNKDNFSNPQKAIFKVYKADGTLRKTYEFKYSGGKFDSGSGRILSHGVGNWGSEWSDTATVIIEAKGKDGKTYQTPEVAIDFLTTVGAAATMRSTNYVTATTAVASSVIGQTASLNSNNALEPYHFTAFGTQTMLPVWGDYSPDYNNDGTVEPAELARLQQFLKAHGYKGNVNTLWDSNNYIGTSFSVLPQLESPGKVYYQYTPKQGGSNPAAIFVQLYKSGATILQPTRRELIPMNHAQIFIVGEKMTPVANINGAYTTEKNYQDLNYYGAVQLGQGEGAYNFAFTATGGKTTSVTINPMEIMPATDLKIENQTKSGWKDMHIDGTYTLDIQDLTSRITFKMDSSFTGVVPNRAKIIAYDENGVAQKSWLATSLDGKFTYLLNFAKAGIKEGWTLGISGVVVDEKGQEKSVYPDADVGLIFTRKMQDWQLITNYIFSTGGKKVPYVSELLEKGFNASQIITASSGSDTTTHSKFTDKSGRDRVQSVYYFNVNADYNYQYGTASAKKAEQAQRVEGAETAEWANVKAQSDEANAIAELFTLEKNTDARKLANATKLFRKDITGGKSDDDDKDDDKKKATKQVLLDLDLVVSAAFIVDDYGYELTQEDRDNPEFKKTGFKYFYSMALLAQLSFSARGSISIPTPIGVPVRIELTGEVLGGVVYSSQVPDGYNFNTAYKITNNPDDVQMHGDNHNVTYARLMGGARIDVGGGLGWSQLHVMLMGKFTLDLAAATPVDPKHNIEHSTGGRFEAKFGVKVKALFFQKFFQLAHSVVPFLGNTDIPSEVINAAAPHLPTITQDDVVNRDYLSARTLPGDTLENGLASLQNGVYPNGTMELISLGGGKQLLVYQDDDMSANDYNASALFARLYDGTSWQDPVKLDNDQTWDEAPTAAMLSDGRVVVAWTDARELLTLGALDDQMHKLRLTGRILKADGSLDGAPFEITNVTDNGETADSNVKLAVYNDGTDDHVLAVYQKSDYKNLYAPTTPITSYEGADPTDGFENITRAYTALAYRTGVVTGGTVVFDTSYAGGGSSDPTFVTQFYGQRFVSTDIANTVIENSDGTKTAVAGGANDAMLVEYDVVRDAKSGQLILAYTLDKDNDSGTEGDRYLYIRTYDAATSTFGTPKLIDHIARGVASPQFASDANVTTLYWLTNRGICSVNASAIVEGSITTGNAGLLASGSNENVYYVTLGNEQENPIQQFRAVSDDNAAYVVWLRSIGNEIDGTSQTFTGIDQDGNQYTDESPNETLVARRLYAAKGYTSDLGNTVWSGSVILTSALGESFDTFTSDVVNGKLSVAGIRHTETLEMQNALAEGDGTQDGKTVRQLVTMFVDKPANLASSAIDFTLDSNIVAGDDAEIAITLENDGLDVYKGCSYQYAVCRNGSEVFTSDWTTISINGGTAEVIKSSLPLPDDLANCSLILRVRDASGTIISTAEKQIEAVTQPIFSGEYAYINADGNIVVAARLTNSGNTAFSGEVKLTDATLDGASPQLDAYNVTLAPNASTDVTFTLPIEKATFTPIEETADNTVTLRDRASFGLSCGDAGCVADLIRELDKQSSLAYNALESFKMVTDGNEINDGDTITLILNNPDYTFLTGNINCYNGVDASALTTEYTVTSGDNVVAVYEPTGQLTPLEVGTAQVQIRVSPASAMQNSFGTVNIDGSRIEKLDDSFYYPNKTVTRTVNIIVKENKNDPIPTPNPVPATGDSTPITALVLALLISALAIVCIIIYKERRKKS